MSRRIWLGAVSLTVLLCAGGTVWWLAADSHRGSPGPAAIATTGADASASAELPDPPAPTGNEIFVGEQLTAFLLSHDDVAASTHLSLDFQVPRSRYVQLRDSYTPAECGAVDGTVERYPGGYRSIDATAALSSSATPPELHQDVYQYGTAASATTAFTAVQHALAACADYVGGTSYVGHPATRTVHLTGVATASRTLPSVAWMANADGDTPVTTNWIALRFENVVTIVRLTNASSNAAVLDAAGLFRLVDALERRALWAATEPNGAAPAVGAAATATATDDASALTAADFQDAVIPSVCEHPAGRLTNGALAGIPEDEGHATLTTNPDGLAFRARAAAGQVAAALVVQCDTGGVSWPDRIVFFDRDRTVLGMTGLGEIIPDSYRDSARRVWFDGSDVRVEWNHEDSSAGNALYAASDRFTWDGSHVLATELTVSSTPVS